MGHDNRFQVLGLGNYRLPIQGALRTLLEEGSLFLAVSSLNTLPSVSSYESQAHFSYLFFCRSFSFERLHDRYFK
jgi:hypothetical protein